MKITYLRKVEGRLSRLSPYFGDERRVWRMLIRAVPDIATRDASNRANDLVRLLMDVPRLLSIIQELKDERVKLRSDNRELQLQLQATIVEEDGVEVEREEPGAGDILVSLGYLSPE